MLDIQYIRDNPDLVKQKSEQKGYSVDIDNLLYLDKQHRQLQSEIDTIRARRNEHAETIKRQGKPTPEQIEIGSQIKSELSDLESKFDEIDKKRLQILKSIPNMPLDDVPVGASEDENVITKTVGDKPDFEFKPKNHSEIAIAKGWLDKERAAKVAGSRFAYLKGDLVILDWALNMFALSRLTDQDFISKIISENDLQLDTKPFVAVQPPAVAKTEVYEATGRLDKEQQTYKLADDDLWLNASAEHVLAPMYLNEIIDEEKLPIRYVGYTTAFRREAGTYGKDMEGFLRMHQFNKLEMESFTTPESSLNEHFLMIAIQESLMQELGLPYQVVTKCTADIGGPNARGVDIDVWLPSQGKYRETHTADLITDYQARRMNTKYRRHQDGSTALVHNNDATALSQRPLIAIIENFQTEQGDVVIPEILRSYMNGKDRI
ncbi:serine--tRNA ligase [Candidatus Saccharibacteria bacterium]|nr:serine--tRNA ligase [Candidatus Saccharibacteria bacterium]